MDPKQNTGNPPLDPKLQDVYNRVMGVNLTGNDAPAEPMPAQPMPQPAMPEPAVPVAPVTPSVPPVLPSDPTITPASVPPSVDMPSIPPASSNMPGEPAAPIPPAPDVTVNVGTPQPTPPEPAVPTPQMPPMDTMSATINIPTHHDNETVKIGLGGSPVGTVAKTKKKGLSPVIFIFGAVAFLIVYAVFWVKFFGLSVPFITQ